MLIQQQTGGNLAEMLDKLAGIVRERFRMRDKIKALTAEGRLQAIILLALRSSYVPDAAGTESQLRPGAARSAGLARHHGHFASCRRTLDSQDRELRFLAVEETCLWPPMKQ